MPKHSKRYNELVRDADLKALYDVNEALELVKKSASGAESRVARAGTIHMPLGKVNFTTEQLAENFTVLLSTLVKARPAAAKGRYLRGITVSATMGPGFKIDPQRAQAVAEKS